MIPLALAACTGADPAPAAPEVDPVAAELQAALDEARAAVGAPMATAAVIRGADRWALGSEVGAGAPFRMGSITKIYVAWVALGLAERGALDLDAPAAEWVPEAPHAGDYTLRQALAHTSGLPDYVVDLGFLADTARPWSPEELLAIVADEPLLFEPGEGWTYSNTNYVVVGLAIDRAAGRPWGELVHDEILDPLDLGATWVPSVDGEPEELVPGWVGDADVSERFHPSAAGAAGEMVADALDVARFAAALFGGELGDPSVAVTPGVLPDGAPTGYGLGVMVDEGPTWGHSGSTMGFQSRVRHEPASGTTVAVLVNDFLAEADEVEAAIWEVLRGR